MSNLNSILIAEDYEALCDVVTDRIADYAHREPDGVLGLFTGGTPIGVYKRVIQRKINLSRITCFNLDERYPIEPDAEQSFHRFMREQFFDHIKVGAWHIPDGRKRDVNKIADDCAIYEEKIRKAGGIGLQGVGIGYNGHVGYNEPGPDSGPDSRTRLVTLHSSTEQYAASEYAPGERVHSQGITMGMGTVMEAREIFQMASNADKVAQAMFDTLTNAPTDKHPSSLLKPHDNLTFFLTSAVAEPYMRHQAAMRLSGRPAPQYRFL